MLEAGVQSFDVRLDKNSIYIAAHIDGSNEAIIFQEAMQDSGWIGVQWFNRAQAICGRGWGWRGQGLTFAGLQASQVQR